MKKKSNSQSFSTKSFYSSSPKLETSFKCKIYRSKYKNELDDEKEVITKIANPERSVSLYRHLDLTSLNESKGVFSFEKKEGKRYFFIHSFTSFFDLYRSIQVPHLYEVIVENRPCHLYFDVEYHFEEHPDFNGEEMINRLISTVDDKLYEVFGIDEFELIHLDSTSPTKFSRHLIFRSNYFCFRDNRQVSTFVHNEILTDPEFAIIVDPAVYSRNRNFRCIWSTKYANEDKYPLVPIDGSNPNPRESNLEYFLKTLITYVGSKTHCIGYPEEQTTQTNQTTPSLDPNGFITIPTSNLSDFYCVGIEQFALSVFAPNGTIRSAKFSPQFNTLTFIIKGCRFCHRIGREHKSNSIYLVARLSSGVIVQRCFDPDCKGFESAPVQIPEQIYQQLVEKYTKNPEFNEPDFKPEKCKPKLEQIPSLKNKKYYFLSDDDDSDSIEL